MVLKTRLTEALGIGGSGISGRLRVAADGDGRHLLALTHSLTPEHPIVMGGMTGVGTPELAAAVSK